MLEILNYRVYDLEESVIACRNAMRTEVPEYTTKEFGDSFHRAIKLVQAARKSGIGCHANFRTGIRVSFDIKYPQYWSMEAQRYHWFDIVTSSSKMHRLTKMDLDFACNEYVDESVKDNLRKHIEEYNKNPNQFNFMKVISNCPMGLELFMRVSTNYEQLATMYKQRKNHKLEDWHIFCKFVESLPYSKELIIGDDGETQE